VDLASVAGPGANFREKLRNAIQSTSKVIVFWSREGAQSPSVNYEIGMAEALGKPIIVARQKGKSPPLPAELSQLQTVEYSNDG